MSGGRATVRPIAGTRPRGATPEQDAELVAELTGDEKELAEHVMLVDLGRNDIGRVAQYGRVEVSDYKVVERYSHVFHLVSQVDGQLREGLDALDAFRAAFPAGTLTGAPKVRAMEIIDELEPERRGAYGGAVGYIGAGGARMDLAITIRTCVIAEGVANVQAAAGIVLDSVPEMEWAETESKMRAMLTAIGRVREAMARAGRPVSRVGDVTTDLGTTPLPKPTVTVHRNREPLPLAEARRPYSPPMSYRLISPDGTQSFDLRCTRPSSWGARRPATCRSRIRRSRGGTPS